MEPRELLIHNSVFRCMKDRELDALQEGAVLRHYHKGQYLAHAGELWPFLFSIERINFRS
jgi:hypothetical protein